MLCSGLKLFMLTSGGRDSQELLEIWKEISTTVCSRDPGKQSREKENDPPNLKNGTKSRGANKKNQESS